MNWIPLTHETQLIEIAEKSYHKPQVIFKHSTRCSISSTVQNRLNNVSNDSVDAYHLDLITHRNISNTIASTYHVHHESPQILLIQNGACTYTDSQLTIQWADVEELLPYYK